MSRTNTIINKTRSIEKVLNGEKKFYAEYSTKVVIINDKPTRIPEPYHVEWCDNRSLEEKVNHTPFFYYVALGERYETAFEEKYFQNKDKAEEYARQLRKEWIKGEESDYYYVVTRIIPFND